MTSAIHAFVAQAAINEQTRRADRRHIGERMRRKTRLRNRFR